MVDRRRNGADYIWDVLLVLGTVGYLINSGYRSSCITNTIGQAGAAWFLTRNLISTLQGTLADPDKEKHEQARLRAKANLQRLQKSKKLEEGNEEDTDNSARNGPRIENLVLNEYENLVALEVVAPEDIPVGFDGERFSPYI